MIKDIKKLKLIIYNIFMNRNINFEIENSVKNIIDVEKIIKL